MMSMPKYRGATRAWRSERRARRNRLAPTGAAVTVLAIVGAAAPAEGAPAAGRSRCGSRPAVPTHTQHAPAVLLRERAAVMFRVNQVGYIANCPKLALAMTRRAQRDRRFEVVRSDGLVVYRSQASKPERWNSRYVAYRLAFDAVRTPGVYRLRFAGLRSPMVRIGGAADLYRPIADAALSFLQSQRDGPDVIPGAMDRRPSHLNDASAQVYRLPRYRDGLLVGHLVPSGVRRDVSGGWFDAGDYLKFVYTASFTDVLLLYTARDYSSGVSDPAALLAEARHGTDWLLKMWDPVRRVLYMQVGIGDGNDKTILGDHDLWRLPQADSHGSSAPGSADYFETHRPVFASGAPGRPIPPDLAGRTAAAFGLCAQVFAQTDPAYAARCLEAGQTLFDQADTHPRGVIASVPRSYYNPRGWRAELELGATELYLATAAIGARTPGLPHSDPNHYLQSGGYWANAYIVAPGEGSDSLNLYDVSTLAAADLVRVFRTPNVRQYVLHGAGRRIPTDVHALMSDRHDQLALADSLARHDPFGLADPAFPADSVTHALGYAVQSRLYDELSGSDAFEALGQQQLGWVLGANPWGSSFIVSAGSIFPHCLASQIPNLSGSLTGRGKILSGAVVDGPTGLDNLTGLGAPDGYRPCPPAGVADPYRGQSGKGMGYLDDVRSPASSEPTDDAAALALLAAAQQASGA
jgi:endoglucanase